MNKISVRYSHPSENNKKMIDLKYLTKLMEEMAKLDGEELGKRYPGEMNAYEKSNQKKLSDTFGG